MTRIGVLLAAGASRRFGAGDKLLADCGGLPLVCRAAGALLAAPLDAVVAVVSSAAVAAVLPQRMELVMVPAGAPMADTLRRAIDLAGGRARRLVIALGDMPGITPEVIGALLALPGSGGSLCEGVRMPPMVLDAADFAAARAAAAGDRGARDFLRSLPADRFVPITPAQARDVDRPADLL